MQLILFVYLRKIPLQLRIGGMFSINSVICIFLVITPLVVKDISIGYWMSIVMCMMIGTAYAIL